MSEEFVRAVIDGLTPSHGIALDLGANEGDYTELLATRFEKVYVFEPFPENVEKLQKRFADNSKVTIVPKAVSNKDGIQRLYLNGVHSEPTLSVMYPQARGWNYTLDNYIEVETITLDTFCEGMDVNFLKVDIEGAEQFMFRGAIKTLTRTAPWILLETHLVVDHELLSELFHVLGYHQFIVHEEDGFKAVDYLWPGTHYLLHKGDVHLTDKME